MISTSSRSTPSSTASSVTRRTLTSLCICLTICSSACSLQSTRSVSRETLGPLGGTDREAVDVVAAPREELRDAGERTRVILELDGQRVLHAVTPSSGSGISITSTEAAPAGTIGKHFSDGSQRASTTAVRPHSSACVSTDSSEPSLSTVKPAQP